MKNASVLNQESAYTSYVHMQDFCIEKNPFVLRPLNFQKDIGET